MCNAKVKVICLIFLMKVFRRIECENSTIYNVYIPIVDCAESSVIYLAERSELATCINTEYVSSAIKYNYCRSLAEFQHNIFTLS